MYRVNASLIETLERRKMQIIDKLSTMLSEDEIRKAVSDHHAKREPIACGMTVHTGIGCSFGCIYCYVPDMGFDMKPRAYPLSGTQLVYALAKNPYFVPGPYGTLLAFGSVTEPFMKESVRRSIDYLTSTKQFLGNPTQVSTKAYIDEDLAKMVHHKADKNISVLVTIITRRYHKVFEPGAPPPEKRLETMRNLSKLNIHVSLFLRPLIPYLNVEEDIVELIREAKNAGARGVVVGSLRITNRIMKILPRTNVVNSGDLLKRLPRKPRNPRDQVPLKMHDLKEFAMKTAKAVGLHVYPSSCAANIESHHLACWACQWGPCGNVRKLPFIDDDSLIDIIEYFGLKAHGHVARERIILRLTSGRSATNRVARRLYHWLTTLTRRQVVMRYKG